MDVTRTAPPPATEPTRPVVPVPSVVPVVPVPSIPSVVLAVDGGKTGSRAALFVDGARVATVTGPGLPHPGEPDAATLIATRVRQLLDQLPYVARSLDTLVAGLTGVTEDPVSAADVPGRLLRECGARKVVVCGDVVTSYAGALGTVPGVVVCAGTGTVVLGVGPDSTTAVVDGWGHLLGDAGSAYDIGRRALDLAVREQDGRGGSPALRALAARRFGDLRSAPSRLYGAERPVRLVAGFAEDVAEAAEAGDRTARALFVEAGGELARSAATAARLTHVRPPAAKDMGEAGEPVPVAWTGGLTRAGAVLTDPFTRELTALLPQAAPAAGRGDALDGGLALARAPGPLLPLLHHAAPTHTSPIDLDSQGGPGS